MFEVIGGELRQWDIGRKVRLVWDGERVDQLHFQNNITENAVVVIPEAEGGALVGEVPNILLQDNSRIIVHAVKVDDGFEQTIFSQPLSVKARQKPDDYVYTETEIFT